jgi:hypothetical protein
MAGRDTRYLEFHKGKWRASIHIPAPTRDAWDQAQEIPPHREPTRGPGKALARCR